MIYAYVFGMIAAIVAVGVAWYLHATRVPPRHAATGWTPAELRQLGGPEVHHEWNASPLPWPPEMRPRGPGGDHAPAADAETAAWPPALEPAAAGFLGAPLLAPPTGDLWPHDVPAAPGGDEAPGPAHPPPPRRDDGRAAAAAVTAPGPGDLPAVTAAVKAMDLDAYAASLPACPWATGEFARILAEVP